MIGNYNLMQFNGVYSGKWYIVIVIHTPIQVHVKCISLVGHIQHTHNRHELILH